MATIIQGEQYAVQIVLTDENNTKITPDNSDDVKVRIGCIELTSSGGGLTYDSVGECWLFPLTQEQTLGLKNGRVNVQAQYKSGNTVISTPMASVDVGVSIIRTVF